MVLLVQSQLFLTNTRSFDSLVVVIPATVARFFSEERLVVFGHYLIHHGIQTLGENQDNPGSTTSRHPTWEGLGNHLFLVDP